MTLLKTQLVPTGAQAAHTPALRGLLAGLEAGPVLSSGLLEVLALRLAPGSDPDARRPFALPGERLKLVAVPHYGTVVFHNTSPDERMIVPMHIGFFQPGAQNHATARTLVMEAGETLSVPDCFCIQAHQGGLLQEAQQRFIMLPLSLRRQALGKRHEQNFSRLWGDIDGYTRQHGIVTGGHLERALRANFDRLQPLRHAVETVAGQVGAAFFVAGRLAGVEIVPHEACWQELAPILLMYCYGPAALLAERRGHQRVGEALDLDGLADLDDLADRLADVRARETADRAAITAEMSELPFERQTDEERHGLRVETLASEPWLGQAVGDGRQTLYLSVFRDVLAYLGRQRDDENGPEAQIA